jgi:hypothetical protein
VRQALPPTLLLLLAHPEPGVFKYNFATGSPRPTDRYTKERGYGFDHGTQPDRINGGIASNKPFYFSVAVPRGTFKVSAFIGDPDAACATAIRANSRLMIEHADTQPARTREVSFVLKVADTSVPLTLEFGGARPCLDALEIRPVP